MKKKKLEKLKWLCKKSNRTRGITLLGQIDAYMCIFIAEVVKFMKRERSHCGAHAS
jgi:hypothetical protein